VEPEINGFLATSPEEWTEALRQLADDPGLRARMGEAGRAKVEREFSTRANAPKLAKVLADALD
jgi:glycosyltransferase involved in cell wall biosynthesis